MKNYISQNELVEMIQLAQKYKDDQVFEGLQKFNLKQVNLLTIQIQEQNLKLAVCYVNLEDVADYYINHYAVDDCNLFSLDKQLFRQIRKSFGFLIKTRFRFRPRSPYGKYNYRGEHVTYSNPSYSTLCGANVQLDLFGAKSFPVSIQNLCHSFAVFFCTLSKCSKLCQDVLDAEEQIRKNPMLCKKLYQQDYQELLQQCRSIVNAYDVITSSDMVDLLGSDSDEAIWSGYHKLTRNQMLAHVLHNEIRKAKQIDLDDDEKYLFAEKPVDYVKAVRYVLKNLDKLPIKGRGNKMSSTAIVFIMDKLKIDLGNGRKFYDYLKKNYSGCYTIPSYQAVNTSKSKSLLKTDANETEALSAIFDKLWEVGISSGKEKSTKLPVSSSNVYALS